jgi:hypothetical protein
MLVSALLGLTSVGEVFLPVINTTFLLYVTSFGKCPIFKYDASVVAEDCVLKTRKIILEIELTVFACSCFLATELSFVSGKYVLTPHSIASLQGGSD